MTLTFLVRLWAALLYLFASTEAMANYYTPSSTGNGSVVLVARPVGVPGDPGCCAEAVFSFSMGLDDLLEAVLLVPEAPLHIDLAPGIHATLIGSSYFLTPLNDAANGLSAGLPSYEWRLLAGDSAGTARFLTTAGADFVPSARNGHQLAYASNLLDTTLSQVLAGGKPVLLRPEFTSLGEGAATGPAYLQLYEQTGASRFVAGNASALSTPLFFLPGGEFRIAGGAGFASSLDSASCTSFFGGWSEGDPISCMGNWSINGANYAVTIDCGTELCGGYAGIAAIEAYEARLVPLPPALPLLLCAASLLGIRVRPRRKVLHSAAT